MSRLLIVETNALSGRDEEFNRWYNDQHLDDVTGMPGALAAQRFEVESSGAEFRYLALYEVTDPQLLAKYLDRYRNKPRMPITDALDPHTRSCFFQDRIGWGTGWIPKARKAVFVEHIDPSEGHETARALLQERMRPSNRPQAFGPAALFELDEWQWKENPWPRFIAIYDVEDLALAVEQSADWAKSNPFTEGRFYRAVSDRVVGIPHRLDDEATV